MADIVTTRIFQDGEKNITAAKLNDIVASSTIQPAFVSSKPSTSTIATTDNLLVLQTAGTYAKAPFQTVIDSVSAGINSDAEIWKVRLRSFNAIGNPTFEVAQNAAGLITSPANGLKLVDRWNWWQPGSVTGRVNAGQVGQATPGPAFLPGTSFRISIYSLSVQLATQQTTLAAGDGCAISQNVEGTYFRELSSDVHSVSMLVWTNVTGGLKFGLSLRDPAGAYSLTKLCTIPAPNVWTLITLPNIPVWTSSGNFSLISGSQGYTLWITLAAGTNWISSAADTWQSSGALAPPGIDNFLGKPVNSRVDFAFVQHEPGAVCSTPMDCPFTGPNGNLEACLRYYQKSYDYITKPGTASTTNGIRGMTSLTTAYAFGPISFYKPMAKVPTVTIYNYSSGAANSLRDNASVDHAVTAVQNLGDSSFAQVTFTTATTGSMPAWIHYTADTGW